MGGAIFIERHMIITADFYKQVKIGQVKVGTKPFAANEHNRFIQEINLLLEKIIGAPFLVKSERTLTPESVNKTGWNFSRRASLMPLIGFRLCRLPLFLCRYICALISKTPREAIFI
jgi:hypothetical protein